MRVYVVRPGEGCHAHTEASIRATLDNVQVWLEESEAGDVVTIKVEEMSKEDYDGLPEYGGP